MGWSSSNQEDVDPLSTYGTIPPYTVYASIHIPDYLFFRFNMMMMIAKESKEEKIARLFRLPTAPGENVRMAGREFDD